MKTAIILHGTMPREEYYDSSRPSPSNCHWLAWLQQQLLVRDIVAQTPEIPGAWNPQYALWQREFERFDITPETMLVGHSCGGGFIVRWLSEHPDVQVGRVVLVAPSLGLTWPDRSFFDYHMDPTVASRTAGMVMFRSDNDKPGVLDAAERYQAELHGLVTRNFHNYGHFTYGGMGTEQFPELLEELIRR